MSIQPSEREIRELWSWFATIADQLAADLQNRRLLEELDTRLSQLGPITWEVGPGTTKPRALAISPDGNRELLAVTERIVALAPELADWELHPARPPRLAGFELTIEGDEDLPVDARSWRYVLFQFPDGTFDVVVEQANLVGAGEDDRYIAAVILIDGLLGEAYRLRRIQTIEVVDALPPDLAVKANAIASLAAHLASLDGGAG